MTERPDPYDDIRHLLRWLYLGLFAAGVVFTSNATVAAVEGRWVGMSLSAVGALAVCISAISTVRRAGRYKVSR